MNNLTRGVYVDVYDTDRAPGEGSPVAFHLIRIRDLSPGVRRSLSAGGSAYAALWWAALVAAALPQPLRQNIPPWLAAIPVSILGPPVCLALFGAEAWKFVFVSLLMVAICLVIMRFYWRRYPESELFGLPLLAAAAVWVGSVWLAVAVYAL